MKKFSNVPKERLQGCKGYADPYFERSEVVRRAFVRVFGFYMRMERIASNTIGNRRWSMENNTT